MRSPQHIPADADLDGSRLRLSMPAAVYPHCVGETAIGETHQRGNVKKMRFADREESR